MALLARRGRLHDGRGRARRRSGGRVAFAMRGTVPARARAWSRRGTRARRIGSQAASTPAEPRRGPCRGVPLLHSFGLMAQPRGHRNRVAWRWSRREAGRGRARRQAREAIPRRSPGMTRVGRPDGGSASMDPAHPAGAAPVGRPSPLEMVWTRLAFLTFGSSARPQASCCAAVVAGLAAGISGRAFARRAVIRRSAGPRRRRRGPRHAGFGARSRAAAVGRGCTGRLSRVEWRYTGAGRSPCTPAVSYMMFPSWWFPASAGGGVPDWRLDARRSLERRRGTRARLGLHVAGQPCGSSRGIFRCDERHGRIGWHGNLRLARLPSRVGRSRIAGRTGGAAGSGRGAGGRRLLAPAAPRGDLSSSDDFCPGIRPPELGPLPVRDALSVGARERVSPGQDLSRSSHGPGVFSMREGGGGARDRAAPVAPAEPSPFRSTARRTPRPAAT